MAKKYYMIREWIHLLAPDIRARLLANMQAQHSTRLQDRLDQKVASLRLAIDEALTWGSSAEGSNFWSRQYNEAAVNTLTPENLRGDIDCTMPEEETP